MNNVPAELNWVEKRAECTAECIFRHLAEGIKKDVEQRNSLGPDTPFAAALTTDGKTLIVGENGTFAREEKIRIATGHGCIQVRNDLSNTSISATAFLNNEGRCMLRLNDGTELEQWQFRRMALEKLFFGD